MLENKIQYGIFLPTQANNYLLETMIKHHQAENGITSPEQILQLITILYKSENLIEDFSTSLISLNQILNLVDFSSVLNEELGEDFGDLAVTAAEADEAEADAHEPAEEDEDSEPHNPKISSQLSEKYQNLNIDMKNVYSDGDNSKQLKLRDLGGMLQQIGICLNLPKIQAAGQKILALVEANLLENNKFRFMYMKPFAPQRHVPGKFESEHLVPASELSADNLKTEILNLLEAGKSDFHQFVNSETDPLFNKIQAEIELDQQNFAGYLAKKEHLSHREALIVDYRVANLYKEKLVHKINVETSVKEINKRGLWLTATPEEMATHGRAEGVTPDSKILFDEFVDPEKKQEHMSAFAIHDVDLEQKLDTQIRHFDSTDGNVEIYLNHEFSDSPISNQKWSSTFKTADIARAHLAFRTKKQWLKMTPMDGIRESIYNFDFATVASKTKK